MKKADLQAATAAAAAVLASNAEKGWRGVGWESRLITSGNQEKPVPVLANAVIALQHSPEWEDILHFNEFTLKVVTDRVASPWWERDLSDGPKWSDNDNRHTAKWLQHQKIFVGRETAAEAVQMVARESRFHPVRDYLDRLKWDGGKRISSWLNTYAGAQQSEYSAAVGEKMLIGAVARIFNPGTKVDNVTILQAKQGSLKSTLVETLAVNKEWFTDEMPDLGTKDAAMQTAGVWILELPELDSMSRAETGKVKAFITRTTDRFRAPYDREVKEAPRQCIFIGTVNHDTYLNDETGARRFWPINCGAIDIAGLKRDRDQLWAEAVFRYRDKTPWWLDSETLIKAAAEQQAARYAGDSWDSVISEWINNPQQTCDSNRRLIYPFSSDHQSVTITDLLNHAICKPSGQWGQSDQNRVARTLKSLGWERFRETSGSWRYRRITVA